MFNFFKNLFKNSNLKVNELEADVYPVSDCSYGGKGELEIKEWSNETFSYSASLKHSGLEDNQKIDIYCQDVLLLSLSTRSGFAQARINQINKADVSKFEVGSRVEFRMNNRVLYEGRLKYD